MSEPAKPRVNISAQERRLEIDAELYEALLNEQDISNQTKREFLTSLWTVITAFVELGYGVHPVDQCEADRAESQPATFMHAAE